MDTLKVNISLPAQMYDQAKALVERGVYASFSEIVRAGIRDELALQEEIDPGFVKAMKRGEESGFKSFKSKKDFLADLHDGV